MIRVLLAEDQAMVRGALASLLALEEDIEVVAEVARGDEVLGRARAAPDVALLDIEMPGATASRPPPSCARALPDTRVVILTTFGRPGYLRRAMESGAAGFLLKDAPASELAGAIRRVVAGERVIDPALAAAALAEGESPLTAREHEVLARRAAAATVADIAARAAPVRRARCATTCRAIKKLGAHTRAEAIRVAEEKGWL